MRHGGRWGSCRGCGRRKVENRKWGSEKAALTQRRRDRGEENQRVGEDGMTIAEQNFWLTTVEAPQIAVRDLPASVDVAVIGAGFTGLSAARTLVKGGARVAVLEAENVGWGASCRNGGMVLSGLKLGTATLIARYGREATKHMYAASLESIDCVEALVREENIDCNFTRSGHLEVACKAKHFEEFRRG